MTDTPTPPSAYGLAPDRLEVRLGDKKPLYTHGEAVAEANRCIYCADAPCVTACPTSIDIPTFIHKIRTDNVKGAARTIFEDNLLGYSCARVCPVEVLCAGSCVYNHWGRPPIEIGRLQRYATELALEKDPGLLAKTRAAPTGRKFACIGAGPASLACAGHLALAGHSVTLFEKKAIPGGLNTLGIAPYKLQADDALAEIDFIRALGDIEIRTGVGVAAEPGEGEVGASALLEDFEAVFVGIGLGPDNVLGIEGEDGAGVVGATHYIERLKSARGLSVDGIERVLVVGGGNTAIDAARELAQLGVPDVTMVYRGTAAKMTGYAHEMDGARHDGVRLVERRQPTRVIRWEDGRVTGLEVVHLDDAKQPIPGTEEILPTDLVAVAIGQSRLTQLAAAFEGVELDGRGRVLVDEATCRTGHAQVYAGGDCVNGGKEVVNAAEHGKRAARAMGA